MVYTVTKRINDKDYNYMVKSVRNGNKVSQVYVEYLGPAGDYSYQKGVPKPIPNRTGVRAIIRKGDKFLLVQRNSGDEGGGLWQFAGGKTDGEEPKGALYREIEEETNLRIQNPQELKTTYNPKKNYWTKYFTADATGDIKLQAEELQNYKWVTKEEAEKMPLTPGAEQTFEEVATPQTNVPKGAKLDTRSRFVIANDIRQEAKRIYDDPRRWKKVGPGRSDLRYWDDGFISGEKRIYHKEFDELTKELDKEFKDDPKVLKQYGRVKKTYSVVGKLQEKNEDKDTRLGDVTDLAGRRIIVTNPKEQRRVVAAVKEKHKLMDLGGEEEDNYLDHPKGGYRGYNMILERDGKPFELQVLTDGQEKLTKYAHEDTGLGLYKGKDHFIEKWGPDKFDETYDYYLKMSDYVHERDTGGNPVMPEAPHFVKTVIEPEYGTPLNPIVKKRKKGKKVSRVK